MDKLMLLNRLVAAICFAIALSAALPTVAADLGGSTFSPTDDSQAIMTEGQSPSSVNDHVRKLMGSVRRWRDHMEPTVTSGGTANAQTLTYTGTAIAAYNTGDEYAFIVGATNTGAATLNVNSLGAKAVQAAGAALTGGELTAGRIARVYYDGTQFQLLGKENLGLGSANAPLFSGTSWHSDLNAGTSGSNTRVYGHGNMFGTTSGAGVFASYLFNNDSDTVDASSAGGFYNAYFGHTFGGSGTKGNRDGLFAFLLLSGATDNAAADGYFYTSVGGEARADANDNGTSDTHSGRVFGSNFIARLTTNATYYDTVVGQEIDVAAEGSSSVNYKAGLSVVQLATDNHQGAVADIAVGIANQASGTAPGWLCGFCVGNPSGWWPIASSGTIMGTKTPFAGGPSYAAAHGVDFSNVTFSSDAFKSTGFSVNGSGDVTGNTLNSGFSSNVGKFTAFLGGGAQLHNYSVGNPSFYFKNLDAGGYTFQNSVGSDVATISDIGVVNAVNGFTDNGTRIYPTISYTTASFGSAILAHNCVTHSYADVTGARTSMAVVVSPQTSPGDGVTWDARVVANDTVILRLCNTNNTDVVEVDSIYNIRVLQ